MVGVLEKEAFIWAAGAFCQLNRIPHDAALLIKQYPPPYTLVQLQQALNGYGLSNSLKSYLLNELPNASLPCLEILKPLDQPPSNDPSDLQITSSADSASFVNGLALTQLSF